jgi:hypothetical protein
MTFVGDWKQSLRWRSSVSSEKSGEKKKRGKSWNKGLLVRAAVFPPCGKDCLTALADLSDDERQKIYSTADFSQFVEDSSKIIQRALSDAYDYTTDYRIRLDAVL